MVLWHISVRAVMELGKRDAPVAGVLGHLTMAQPAIIVKVPVQ